MITEEKNAVVGKYAASYDGENEMVKFNSEEYGKYIKLLEHNY